MAITCKEDLQNTFIRNDKGLLRNKYKSAAEEFGFIWDKSLDESECYLVLDTYSDLTYMPSTASDNSDSHKWFILHGFRELTIADFEPEEIPVRSWEGKCPCAMTNDELKEFLCDRVDGIPMELYLICGWELSDLDTLNDIKSFSVINKYRIKREPKLTPQQIKIAELETTIARAQQQLQELKSELK